MLWRSRCLIRCEWMMCSKVLQRIQVSEIGRYLAAAALSPFLKIGETKALFQMAGMMPCLIDAWKSRLIAGDISAAAILRSFASILSGPRLASLGAWRLQLDLQ